MAQVELLPLAGVVEQAPAQVSSTAATTELLDEHATQSSAVLMQCPEMPPFHKELTVISPRRAPPFTVRDARPRGNDALAT